MSPVQLALNVPDIDDAVDFVEVPTSDDVWAHQQRLAEGNIEATDGSGTCCFARQDKVWVDGPDGAWEIYAVLEDADAFS